MSGASSLAGTESFGTSGDDKTASSHNSESVEYVNIFIREDGIESGSSVRLAYEYFKAPLLLSSSMVAVGAALFVAFFLDFHQQIVIALGLLIAGGGLTRTIILTAKAKGKDERRN